MGILICLGLFLRVGLWQAGNQLCRWEERLRPKLTVISNKEKQHESWVSQSVVAPQGSSTLRGHPLCLCVCRRPHWGFLQSVSWWAFDSFPSPHFSLFTSLDPANRRPRRSGHVTLPPFLVATTTSPGPGSILVWWEEERGGERRQEERQTERWKNKEKHKIKRRISARGIHIWT